MRSDVDESLRLKKVGLLVAELEVVSLQHWYQDWLFCPIPVQCFLGKTLALPITVLHGCPLRNPVVRVVVCMWRAAIGGIWRDIRIVLCSVPASQDGQRDDYSPAWWSLMNDSPSLRLAQVMQTLCEHGKELQGPNCSTWAVLVSSFWSLQAKHTEQIWQSGLCWTNLIQIDQALPQILAPVSHC